MNLGKWLALCESLCSIEDKPSQSSGGNRLKTCWGLKISSLTPTHDMMIITFFTFIYWAHLSLVYVLIMLFFLENTYNTYYNKLQQICTTLLVNLNHRSVQLAQLTKTGFKKGHIGLSKTSKFSLRLDNFLRSIAQSLSNINPMKNDLRQPKASETAR